MGCHNVLFALEENCSQKSVRFVDDGSFKLLLPSRREVALESKQNRSHDFTSHQLILLMEGAF